MSIDVDATTARSDEHGIALIAALFMVLLLSVLGSSMMFLSRSEALSSLNYKTMSQARYAAESGLHAAANHLLYTYVPPSSNATDDAAFYDLSTSPVRASNAPVVLSSSPGVASNYPVSAVQTAFNAASQGTLSAGVGTMAYTASARLLSMRVILDSVTASLVTLQTWEITGRGTVGGAGSAQVEVSAIIERQERPVFGYGAFATSTGCGSLTLGGNFDTDSYDSRTYGGSGTPVTQPSGGNVGTNGNLEIAGSANVNGSLSTPRSGVGNCANGNITALSGNIGSVTGGITQLPQPVTWPTPAAPNPMPPQSNDSFTQNGGCPASLSGPVCVASASGATVTPTAGVPVVLGNVSMGNQAVVHLRAGTYIVNSLNLGAQSSIVIDSGPVIFQVAGQNTTDPVDTTGGSFANSSFDPWNFQIVYGGSGNIHMAGGSGAASTVYAPNANVEFVGNADIYGSIIANRLNMTGNASIHYDRALDTKALTVGNQAMSSFSWKSF